MIAISRDAPMITEAEIKTRISELAEMLDRDYGGTIPVLLGVLTGSFILVADLCRAMKSECLVDFVRVESYGEGTVSTGRPRMALAPKIDLKGRHVLVVDEIVDTGLTLSALLGELRSLGPAEIKTLALIDKKSRRRVPLAPDYVGFSVEDGFLVGYGLDAAEKMRTLPEIRLLNEN